MSILRFIFRILINKFFLTTVAFVVWMIFFDSNNLLTRNRLQDKLDVLNLEKQFYQQEIRKDSILSHQLMTDSSQLERFARERYLMKKVNEDLFLVVDTTEDPRR